MKQQNDCRTQWLFVATKTLFICNYIYYIYNKKWIKIEILEKVVRKKFVSSALCGTGLQHSHTSSSPKISVGRIKNYISLENNLFWSVLIWIQVLATSNNFPVPPRTGPSISPTLRWDLPSRSTYNCLVWNFKWKFPRQLTDQRRRWWGLSLCQHL